MNCGGGPIVTFFLASYEGGLFALLAVTAGSLLICDLWHSQPLHAVEFCQDAQRHGLERSESHHDRKAA